MPGHPGSHVDVDTVTTSAAVECDSPNRILAPAECRGKPLKMARAMRLIQEALSTDSSNKPFAFQLRYYPLINTTGRRSFRVSVI